MSAFSEWSRTLLSTALLPQEWSFKKFPDDSHHYYDDDDDGSGGCLFFCHVVIDRESGRVFCDRTIVLTPSPIGGGNSVRVEASCQLGLVDSGSAAPSSSSLPHAVHSCSSSPTYMSATLGLDKIEDVLDLLSNPLCIPPCGGGGVDEWSSSSSSWQRRPRSSRQDRSHLTRGGNNNKNLYDDERRNFLSETAVSSSTNAGRGLRGEQMGDEVVPVKSERSFDESFQDFLSEDNLVDSWVSREMEDDQESGFFYQGEEYSNPADVVVAVGTPDDPSHELRHDSFSDGASPLPIVTTSAAIDGSVSGDSSGSIVLSQSMKDLMSHKNQKTKNYSLDFKLGCIEEIEGGKTVGAVSRQIGVDRRCIRNWFGQKVELRKMKSQFGDSLFSTRKRLQGAGARVKFAKVEEELSRYIWAIRSKGLVLSRTQMQDKMQKLITEAKLKGEIDPDAKFQASASWLVKFLKRHNFSLRPKITQKAFESLEDKVCAFLAYVYAWRTTYQCHLSNIYNVDEIKVCVTSPSSSSSADISIPPEENLYLTVMLSVSADGSQYKPFVIVKTPTKSDGSFNGSSSLSSTHGSTLDPQLKDQFPNLVITSQSEGRLTPSLFTKFLEVLSGGGSGGYDGGIEKKAIIGGDYFCEGSLLVWDSIRDHLSPSIESESKRRRLQVANIPGGATRFLQPADLGLKEEFRTVLTSRYKDWILFSSRQHREDGGEGGGDGSGVSLPPLELVLRWVSLAWTSVSSNIVVDAFRRSGISVDLDGSQDGQIEFFRKLKSRNGIAKVSELRRRHAATTHHEQQQHQQHQQPPPSPPPPLKRHEETEEDETIILVTDDDVMRFHHAGDGGSGGGKKEFN